MSTSKIPISPLAIWLGVQCLAIGVSALRVPLSNAYAQPAERVAMEQLVLVQVAAAAVLFPVLLTNASATIVAIAATWPFVMLARMLAGEGNNGVVVAGGIYLALWIVALALARSAVKTARGQLLLSAAALLLAIGGPILWYLHAEFMVREATINWRTQGVLGPVMGAWAVMEYPLMKRPWAFVGGCVLAALLTAATRRSLDRKKTSRFAELDV